MRGLIAMRAIAAHATGRGQTERARCSGLGPCRLVRRSPHVWQSDRKPRLSSVICPSGNFVSSPLCKNISVFTHPKSLLELFASHPTRGAYRDRHGRRGGMRWTRQRFAREVMAGRVERLVSDQQHADERRLQRTAKSCGPDAPTLASSSRMLSRPYRA